MESLIWCIYVYFRSSLLRSACDSCHVVLGAEAVSQLQRSVTL